MVRPETIVIAEDRMGSANLTNLFPARLEQVVYLGEAVELIARIAETPVKVLHFRPSNGGLRNEIWLNFSPNDIALLPYEVA